MLVVRVVWVLRRDLHIGSAPLNLLGKDTHTRTHLNHSDSKCHSDNMSARVRESQGVLKIQKKPWMSAEDGSRCSWWPLQWHLLNIGAPFMTVRLSVWNICIVCCSEQSGLQVLVPALSCFPVNCSQLLWNHERNLPRCEKQTWKYRLSICLPQNPQKIVVGYLNKVQRCVWWTAWLEWRPCRLRRRDRSGSTGTSSLFSNLKS